MNLLRVLIPLLALGCGCAHAQSWSPQKPIEIVVPNAPGGTNDKLARAIESVLVGGKLIDSPVAVLNKPGGGSQIAYAYLNQRSGDPHVLIIGGPGALVSHVVERGKLSYLDMTPIALIFNDYMAFAVNAAAPVKTGQDLVTRMRSHPRSVTVGCPSAAGGLQHIVAGLFMKAIGGNARDLKMVFYKGSSEAVMSLLGGHVDLVTTGAGNASVHVAAGKLRAVGISASQRLHGSLASVPTWKEQGVDLTYGSWRAIFAPKGLTREQVGYWENMLRKVTENPQWKTELQNNYWSDYFTIGAPLKAALDKDHGAMKVVLADLGLAK